MNAFFGLLGAVLGLLLGHGGGVARIVLILLCCALSFAWAKSRKGTWWFLAALAIGVTFSMLEVFWPETLGYGTYEGFVVKSADNYVVLQSGLRRYYVSISNNAYEVGDYLRLSGTKGEFTFTTYESRFDFSSYLKDFGARYEITSYKHQALWKVPLRFRAYQKNFLSSFSSHAKAMLDSLLFGKKDYSSSFIDAASSLNVLFVLSSSGLFYQWALKGVKRVAGIFAHKYADVITLAVGAVFLPFGFAKVGIIRAFSMRLIHLLDERFWKRDLDYLTRLGIAGLAILGIDVHYAFQTGFLLGFGICLAMYFLGPRIKHKKKLIEKARGFALLRLFLLPLSMSSGGIHLFSGVFSLLLAPFSFLVVALGFLSLATIPFTVILNPIGDAFYALLTKLEAWNVTIPLPAPSTVFLGGFYLLYYFAIYLSEMHFHGWRRLFVSAFIGIYAFSLLPIIPLATQSVSFLNVGQGDCCLIQDGTTTVMIDTGGVSSFDIAEESLIPYLRKKRIYHIDALIASHQDYDHIGGVESLQKHFNVRKYVKEREDFPLTVGNLTFTNYNVFDAKEENDRSLVLSLNFMDKAWLFTGDAPTWVERSIIAEFGNIDCDILKVGHHGSDTSTCVEWVDALTPEEAVISVGRKNKYGHPKASVLSILYSRGVTVRRTDLEGTITYARIRR